MRHEDVLGDVLAIDAKTMQMHRQSRGGGKKRKDCLGLTSLRKNIERATNFTRYFFLSFGALHLILYYLKTRGLS